MEIIKLLKEKGISKWRIAKEIGVTWQTVHMWEKEIFKPSDDKMEKLTSLLEKGVK